MFAERDISVRCAVRNLSGGKSLGIVLPSQPLGILGQESSTAASQYMLLCIFSPFTAITSIVVNRDTEVVYVLCASLSCNLTDTFEIMGVGISRTTSSYVNMPKWSLSEALLWMLLFSEVRLGMRQVKKALFPWWHLIVECSLQAFLGTLTYTI